MQLLQVVNMVLTELEDLQNKYTAELQYVMIIKLLNKITRGNSSTMVSSGAAVRMTVQTALYR